MTLTLTLTPERETRLQQQAQTAGLPLEEYALRVLLAAADTPLPRTGADLITQWTQDDAFLPEGDSQPDSPERARQIRANAWGQTSP